MEEQHMGKTGDDDDDNGDSNDDGDYDGDYGDDGDDDDKKPPGIFLIKIFFFFQAAVILLILVATIGNILVILSVSLLISLRHCGSRAPWPQTRHCWFFSPHKVQKA